MVAASTMRRFGKPKTTRILELSALHPAHRTGRSIFGSRVFDPSEVRRVLKSGHQSRKIGKVVAKGHRRGWPIYTLTLEERATCPRSCRAWSLCYGNSMQAAERIVAGEALEEALMAELAELQLRHPGGFMVRLHVLGDFYSERYVALWSAALAKLPALHVFGFTARAPGTPIGDMLAKLADEQWDRFAVRLSGGAGRDKCSILEGDEGSDEAIPCPAQSDATDCCATCALCWHSTRSIMFRRH
jgi:hypothetical protein